MLTTPQSLERVKCLLKKADVKIKQTLFTRYVSDLTHRELKNEILRWKAILRSYKLGFEDIIYTQNPIASRMEIKT